MKKNPFFTMPKTSLRNRRTSTITTTTRSICNSVVSASEYTGARKADYLLRDDVMFSSTIQHESDHEQYHEDNQNIESERNIVTRRSSRRNASRDKSISRFACICSKTFATKQKMEEHVQSIHGGNRYACTQCDPVKWFTSKTNLRRHCTIAKHVLPPQMNRTQMIGFGESDQEDGNMEN